MIELIEKRVEQLAGELAQLGVATEVCHTPAVYRDTATLADGRKVEFDNWFYDSSMVRPSDLPNVDLIHFYPAFLNLSRMMHRICRGRALSELASDDDLTLDIGPIIGSYAKGYLKFISVEGQKDRPSLDQIVKIGGHKYAVIEIEDFGPRCNVMLDKPVQEPINEGEPVKAGLEHAGVKFHTGGMTLVSSLLPGDAIERRGLSLRMDKKNRDDGNTQVTLDILAGLIVDPSKCELVNDEQN